MNLPIGLYRSTWNSLWLIFGGFSLLSMVLFYVQFSIYTQRSGIGKIFMGILAVLTPLEAVYMFFYSRRRLRQDKTADVEI